MTLGALMADLWDVSTWEADAWLSLVAMATTSFLVLRRWFKTRQERSTRAALKEYQSRFAEQYGYLDETRKSEKSFKAFVTPAVIEVDPGGEATRLDTVPKNALLRLFQRADPIAELPVHLVILGDPGSGKSTLLRAFGDVQLRELAETRYAFDGRERQRRPRIPIFVTLSEFARSLRDIRTEDAAEDALTKHVLNIFVRQGVRKSDSVRELFGELLRSHRVDLLLDGLDEVPKEWREPLLWAIRRFGENMDQELPTARARMLITCRTENFSPLRDEWHEALGHSGELRLQPMRDSDIHEYIRLREGGGRWTQTAIQNFLDTMRDVGTINLVRYPLILKEAVDQYEQEGGAATGAGVAVFYQRMIEKLLGRVNHGMAPEKRFKGFKVSQILEALQVLAETNACAGTEKAFLYFTYQDLKDVCSGYNWDDRPNEEQLTNLVSALIERSGLISALGDEASGSSSQRRYYFSLRSYQEFLVSRHLARSPQTGAALLMQRLSDDSWHLVIPFFAAQLTQSIDNTSKGEVDHFLLQILSGAEQESNSNTTLRLLGLAGRCLAWSKPSKETATRIVEKLYTAIAAEIDTVTDDASLAGTDIRDITVSTAMTALLSGLRSPHEDVRGMVESKTVLLAEKLSSALSEQRFQLPPDPATISQMIDGITAAHRAEAVCLVAQLLPLTVADSSLAGPLWRCLQKASPIVDDQPAVREAAAMIVEKLLNLAVDREGFDELASQPALQKLVGERRGTQSQEIPWQITIPPFFSDKLINKAYPFFNGLPNKPPMHPLVALLCWQHHLDVRPEPARNRYLQAKLTNGEQFATVEAAWRSTKRAVLFRAARIWSTLGIFGAIGSWIALFTVAYPARGVIARDVWLWAFLGLASAAALFMVSTGSAQPEATARFSWLRKKLTRLRVRPGAAPQQGEAGSAIPELFSRLLPESLAQVSVIIAPLLMTIPLYWIAGLTGPQFGATVFAAGMLFVWIPSLRVFDHGKRNLRNKYLDVYFDESSRRWISSPETHDEQPKRAPGGDLSEVGDMRVWFASVTSTVAVGTAIVALLIFSLGYRNAPFDRSVIAVLGIGLALVASTYVYARRARMDSLDTLRLLLRTVGSAFIVAGLAAMAFGEQLLNVRGITAIGAATVLGGAIILYCALYMRTEFDWPTASPHPVEIGHRTYRTVKADLFRYQSLDTSTNIESEINICGEAVDLERLHYVAYYHQDRMVFSLDLLGYEKLRRGFSETAIDPNERRRQYGQHGHRVHQLVARFNQQFNQIRSGKLLRVVLDVERGALYYFFVDVDRYLIGVTLDQNEVHETDRKLVHLVTDLRANMGLLPISELEDPIRWSEAAAQQHTEESFDEGGPQRLL